MDFEELRVFIANAKILPQAKSKTNKNKKYDAIFLVEKPAQIEADKFIVYRFNEVGGGKVVRQYAVELKVCANDILSLIEIKDNLIKLLDFHDRSCEITQYVKCVLSNEGGIYFDENNNFYVDKLFFEVKRI